MKKLYKITLIGLLISVLQIPLVAQTGIIHVNKAGSAAPDGTQGNPYQLIEAGICKAQQTNQTVLIQGGAYNELLTIDQPIQLKATGSGVVIGTTHTNPPVTLKILTYNTFLTDIFKYQERGRRFGELISDEDADVVGLTEVWDQEDADNILMNASRSFPFHYYYDANNGLLLLSKQRFLPIAPFLIPSPIFITFSNQEAGAAGIGRDKGFTIASIRKGDFAFGVFLTHLASEDRENVRRDELQQIKDLIDIYHTSNPDAEIVLMGDLNIVGEGLEYQRSLIPILQMHDAFRNAPCFDKKEGEQLYTNYYRSELFRCDNSCRSRDGERLDYILYSQSNSFELLPVTADVKRFRSETPICDNFTWPFGGCCVDLDPLHPVQTYCARDLSDHFGLFVQFNVFR